MLEKQAEGKSAVTCHSFHS